ncbi:hypothetical protein Dsin_020151 [Dipteronia sinensis]|uniref:Uncharacterized protein n=1 Tax=Dipteronia sinensis TaxID=43782 RepID=A0AAE0A8W3_9ROSI|nr:hypothetical protein Dsin_020151 [Dipteronia sinensis]
MASWSTALKQVQEHGFTLKHLLDFHNIDRELYRRLVLQLGIDPFSSKKIVALWVVLERIFHFRDFVKNTKKLDSKLLMELVREAVKCLNFFYRRTIGPVNSGVGVLPSTCIFVGIDSLSLDLYICWNRVMLVKKIEEFMNDLGITIFEDIDGEFIRMKESKKGMTMTQASSSSIDRTLFVTFSKGHPVTKEQLSDFFNRKYGENCVETIYMGQQGLYARVVVQSISYVTLILGEKELAQFSVDGKDIRVRRFVLKNVEQQPQPASSLSPTSSPSSSLNQDSRPPSPSL